MHRKVRLAAYLTITALVVTAGPPVAPAAAGCTDPAAPGVNWRRCYLDQRRIVGQHLSNAILRSGTFSRSDFSGSDLSAIDGRGAKFLRAKLSGVKFDGARLIEADFTRADLAGASFRNADLRRVRFFRAILRKADFTGARFGKTDLQNADLSGATWVDGKTVCAENSIGQCN